MPQVKHFGVFTFKPEVRPDGIAACFREMAGMVGTIPGLGDYPCGRYDSPEGLNDGFLHGFIMTFATAAEGKPRSRADPPPPPHENVGA